MSKFDFCGLWRQGEGEPNEFLMCVTEWREGCSMTTALKDRLWIRAEIVKCDEGFLYPRTFRMILPGKRFVFVPDTYYHTHYQKTVRLRGRPMIVEFSGDVYGPSPLREFYREGSFDVVTKVRRNEPFISQEIKRSTDAKRRVLRHAQGLLNEPRIVLSSELARRVELILSKGYNERRANRSEKTGEEERAIEVEKTMRNERATRPEETRKLKRAIHTEEIKVKERAR